MLLNSGNTTQRAEAESEFKTARALNPRDSWAELELGLTETKQGQLNAAFADPSRALEVNSDDSLVCTQFAKLPAVQDHLNEAQQIFERAIRIDPTHDVAHGRLATIDRREENKQKSKKKIQVCLKFKKMKDRMGRFFEEMRNMPPQSATNGDNGQ